MILEFQITAGRLEELLHQRMIMSRPCITMPIQFNGEPHYVDHLTVGPTLLGISTVEETISLNRVIDGVVTVPEANPVEVTLRRLQVMQRVIVNIASLSSLREGQIEGANSFLPLTLDLVLTLSVSVSEDGRPSLCATLNDIQGLPEDQLSPETIDQIVDTVRDSWPSCANFNLEPLSRLTGGELPMVVNAGIAAPSSLNPVAIRLDLNQNRSNEREFWTNFYQGSFDSRLFGADWSLLFHKNLLVPAVEAGMETQLDESPRFHKEWGPTGYWRPIALPLLQLRVGGEIVDACAGIDIDVDVTINVTFSVPENNVMRTRIEISWDGDFWEEVACEILASLFWPVIGAMFLGDGKIKWYEFVGGLSATADLLFFGAIIYLSSDDPASEISEEMDEWSKVSETVYTQDRRFLTNIGDFVTGMTLTNTFILPDGLVLTGTVSPVEPIIPNLTTGPVVPFKWVVDNPCHGGSDLDVEPAKIPLFLDPMGVGNSAPVTVGQVRVIEDDLHMYDAMSGATLQGRHLESSELAEIRYNFPDAEPVVGDYDCQVLIISNAGARLITIPAPPPRPDPPSEDDGGFLGIKWALCTKDSSIWNLLGIFNPKWHVDPPPDQIVMQQYWVMVSGLKTGDEVSLLDELGRQMARARIGQDGMAQLNALFQHATAESALTISLNGATMSLPDYERRAAQVTQRSGIPKQRLDIKQVLLVRTGAIALSGKYRQMRLGYFEGAPALLVVTSTDFRIYRFDESDAGSRLAFVARSRGLRGVVHRRNELLAWGDGGLAPLADAFNTPRRGGACSEAQPVLDVAISGPLTYVLRPDGISIHDQNMCDVAQVSVKQAQHFTVAHDRLAVATRRGLIIYDLSIPHSPVRAGFVPLKGIQNVERARGATFRRAVYVRGSERAGRVFDLTNPAKPVAVAEYSQRPWFSESVRRGGFVARLDESRETISFYRVAGTSSGSGPRPAVDDMRQKY